MTTAEKRILLALVGLAFASTANASDFMGKYDDASWHYGGDFPSDLPDEAGATHIGMFVAWALSAGLAGSIHTQDFPENMRILSERSMTPGQFFLHACDGKFTDEDLNESGNRFAAEYFDISVGLYFSDYEATLGQGLPSLYHVEDTWENFDRLKPVLDDRFRQWKTENE